MARIKGEMSKLSLTCRRSFHLAAPKGAETAVPGTAPPLPGPSPEARSALSDPASVTRDSIPLEPPTHETSCLHHSSSLPGPALLSSLSGPETPGLPPTALDHPGSAFPVFASPWQPGQRCSRHCTILPVATLSEGGPGGEGAVAELVGRCFFLFSSPLPHLEL